eukprot:3288500-Prymnesium_polylepis.2
MTPAVSYSTSAPALAAYPQSVSYPIGSYPVVEREYIKEVPKEVIKYVDREVIKEVPKEVVKTVDREVIKEVKVEVPKK